MLYRILKILLPFLAVAAVSVAGPAYAGEEAQPCPGVISESEALRIAWDMAGTEADKYENVDIRAAWVDADWTVLFTEIGGPYWFFVNVRADGRVVDCFMDVQCEPDPGLDVPACGVIAGDFVARDEAAAIARDYVARHNLAPMPMRVDSAIWFGAHWRVWMTPRGPAPLGIIITVYVSPDGSEAELTEDMGIPSDTSFLSREPVAH